MPDYNSLFTSNPVEQQGLNKQLHQPGITPYHLLFVDDEPNILSALKRVFHQENYKITTATDGNEALAVLKNNPCQLMISDYKMPGMNGAELLKKAKALYPQMIRIMLTGQADTAAVMAAIKEGAVYKFILKPLNADDLRVTVALALEQYELIRKNIELKNQNILKEKEINKLATLKVSNQSQLAFMLNKRHLLTDNQLQELVRQQQLKKQPIIKQIIDRNWVDWNTIQGIFTSELFIEEVDLKEIHIEPNVSAILPGSLCEYHWVLPMAYNDNELTLVVADPLDSGLLDDLRFVTGMNIKTVLAKIQDLQDKITDVYGEQTANFGELESFCTSTDPYEGIEVVIDSDDDISIEELLKGTDEPPAIRLVNAIILQAIQLGASDIHIQPRSMNIAVRYRIDGVLVDKFLVPNTLLMPLVSRIKIMAELDIAERRKPQDGRITVKTAMRINDLRISTLPTINGEKVVMRLLDRNSEVIILDDLGFSPVQLTQIENAISKPQGIILATGPTGSGKTTTLYSLLQHDATPEKNYVTIEDPVEYYMDMAGQVMIKEKIGLDFVSVLRAILRQDPDVLLIGEIRDSETAEVAFQAALTGHQVFSTLHTNSAIATISRLLEMGLKAHTIASSLQAIISQRLVRKICIHCKQAETVSQKLLYKLGPTFSEQKVSFFKGMGCEKCNNTGYSGRIALYEVFSLSDKMLQLIESKATVLDMQNQSKEEGLITLIQSAREKVNCGLTTADEVIRILGSQASSPMSLEHKSNS